MAMCVSVAAIEQAVALQLHVMPEDIQDMTMRSDNVADARALVALLCRECTSVSGNRSWQQIAGMLGYAGHSSARRAAQSVRQRIERNPDLGETLTSIRRFLSYDFSIRRPPTKASGNGLYPAAYAAGNPIPIQRPNPIFRPLSGPSGATQPTNTSPAGRLNSDRRISSRCQTPIENGQKVVITEKAGGTTHG